MSIDHNELKRVLDKHSAIPLYHQLKCSLMEEMDSGQWQSGQQLPNEGKLAATFGVSKITVRQALQELANLGYVRREQGRGTFVSKATLDHGPRDLTSFSEEMRRHRLVGSSRVIENRETSASSRVAEALRLKVGEPVFLLKRLRLADGEPIGIQTAYLPMDLAPGLAGCNWETSSLYTLLRTKYGLQPARAHETYCAVPAEPAAAELLGIACGAPVFEVERVTFPSRGEPFEFVQSIMRGDRYRVILDLVGHRPSHATRRSGVREPPSVSGG